MTGNNAPIFIVGVGHSGTSLLIKLMGLHSRIGIIPFETNFAYVWPEPCEKARKFFARCSRFASCLGKARWVEKTPSHIFRIKEILEHVPEGKILLIIRDGRDVAYSFKERFGTVKGGVERWINGNRAGEAFWKHPNVHVVKYESLVTDLEKTLREIMAFLGEEFEERQLRHHETPVYYFSSRIDNPGGPIGEKHPQYRNWQINQPLFDGRGKWQRLSEEEKQLVKTRMGEMLVAYGYTAGMDW
jgi:hypothetical protein